MVKKKIVVKKMLKKNKMLKKKINFKNFKNFLKKYILIDPLELDTNNPLLIIFMRATEIISATIAVIILLLGTIESASYLSKGLTQRHAIYIKDHKKLTATIDARIRLGDSINLGLTFLLASDIVKTIRIPSYYQLGRVVILVLIREFVTYYLDRELRELRKGLD